MTELSGFWTTGGTKGDQQVSYTQAQWSTAASIIGACSGFEGVAPGYLNGLAGTVTGANTVAINTGGGMCDGKWFNNSASQNVTVASSAGGTTRIDRIVLRADWANFNVSVYLIAGVDAASPTAPAITQTSGTTYDVKLYQALVNSSGTVTLTDERTWGSHPGVYRQGGSATVWSSAGTTNYTPSYSLLQTGAIEIVSGTGISVTFPRGYSNTPIVFLTMNSVARMPVIDAISATSVHIHVFDNDGSASTGTVNWLAIGPP